MQPDTTIEQSVPKTEVLKNETQLSSEGGTFEEASSRFNTATGNLIQELGDLVDGNSDVDLVDEQKEMDRLANDAVTLTETVGSALLAKPEKDDSGIQQQSDVDTAAPKGEGKDAANITEEPEESEETRKARIDSLWSAWEEIQKNPELVALFDRKVGWDSNRDPREILKENGFPERTKISDLQFENWTVNLDPKFLKDGHIYLLRGDHPGLEKKGFYTRPYGYGKKTTGQLAHELHSPEDVGYFLTQDERFLKQKTQSNSVAQQLAYQQSAMGGSSFISATTNLEAARAGTGNQPDHEEQAKYQVYVLRIPQEAVINSNTGNHFGMNENESLISDYITPDEIVATFPRDSQEEIYQYMYAQLGITREDLGMKPNTIGTENAESPKVSPDRIETPNEQEVFLFRYENPQSENKAPDSQVSQDELVGSWFTDSPASLKDYIKKKQPGGVIRVLRIPKDRLEALKAINHPVAKDMDIEPIDNFIIPGDLISTAQSVPLEVQSKVPNKFLFGEWGKINESVDNLTAKLQTSIPSPQ